MKRYPEIVDYSDLLVPERQWLSLAGHLRAWSHDPDVQVGAVMLPGTGRQAMGMGWNRFPVGIPVPSKGMDQDTKRATILHAEAVAMNNCIAPQGGTLFMSGAPMCSHCAALAVENRVAKIVMQHRHISRQIGRRWVESHELAKGILRKAGIVLFDVE